MQVRKRNGKIVEYDREFIVRAVTLAAAAAGEHGDEAVRRVVDDVEAKLTQSGAEIVDIEAIQDAVEEALFEQGRFKTAKAYILYRMDKEKTRGVADWKEGLLSREFLSKYKHAPSPMGELGSFVYSRTYSRYIPQLNRREFWWETVRRAVEYNCSLAPTTREEAEKLYDNIYNLRQFLSGRTLWVGQTPVSEAYPMANYNCAFEVIDDYHAYHDLFYLLMVGSGVGVRVLKSDAEKLPPIR
ncbi:MAG: ATP cone domain-containing protein, partial [Clostridiales bacterium]|nr:ATP cone domain-containing protein [Clostridiales bacterium]